MARIRFYTDEQVARAVVTGLRRRGVDVLVVGEIIRGLMVIHEVLEADEMAGRVEYL